MAIYLDDTQRETIASLATTWTWRTQWPTWVLIVAIYGGWFAVATHARELGLPLTAALLALASAWYMSLQQRSQACKARAGLASLKVDQNSFKIRHVPPQSTLTLMGSSPREFA